MVKIVERIKMLVKDEEGASAVEYGVLVAGIILISILVIYALGGKVGEAFSAVESNMQAPGTPVAPSGG